MTEHINKTLSMPQDVADRLEEEDNQSAVVREALREYWSDTEGNE